MADKNVQRLPAEELYQRELDALISAEAEPVPTGWRMSPRSVLAYLTGNAKVKGVEITPKYMGNKRLVEIAIATLVTDRALLLIGEPGTAKSWLSEHLAAAVNGDSTKVVQGTAGTTEEHIRYSWNYAMLIAKGPCPEAMVKSHRPGGGDFPLRQRGAGRAHLHSVGEAAQRPRAGAGGARRQGFLRHRHSEHPG